MIIILNMKYFLKVNTKKKLNYIISEYKISNDVVNTT